MILSESVVTLFFIFFCFDSRDSKDFYNIYSYVYLYLGIYLCSLNTCIKELPELFGNRTQR
jgi:hypothetical protein